MGVAKVVVAPAASAAFGDDMILTGGHIHNDLTGFGIPDDCASGNLDDQILAPFAAHIPALAACACLGGVLAFVAEIQKGGQIVVDPQDHTAAMAAVAAVGTAGGYIFFSVESNCSVTAVTCLYLYFR